MLSNKSEPVYYSMFRRAVLDGKIPVNKYISMQMNRIDARIKDPRFYYDDEAINGYINYCENELTLTNGDDLTLLDSFKLWAEDVFGWYYFMEKEIPVRDSSGNVLAKRTLVKKRLTNKQYLIVGRGAAKTLYMSTIQSYFLNVIRLSTKQITTAPTMYMAEEVLNPIKVSIARARGPLFKFLTEGSLQNTTGDKSKRLKLCPTKKGIENFLTQSIIQIKPMQINKLQGLQPMLSTVDEWLSCDIKEDVIGALEQGGTKLDDYLIIAASSEGTIRNDVGDSIKMELLSILRGEYDAPNVSIWYYRLDDIEEVNDYSMWVKANPNIGYIVSYEAYKNDVERAEKIPSVRNDILAKRFGIPVSGYTYYFTYEETIPFDKIDFWGMPCSMGMDASLGDDFWSFSFLFPLKNGQFGVKLICFITTRTYKMLLPARMVKYQEFINEGSLIIHDDPILDSMRIFDEIDKLILDNNYEVYSFGYDPYNAKEFVNRWIQENGEYGVTKVIQGAKTESVPLGELKKLAEDRSLIFDQEIMSFCMGNCVVDEDTNGNRKLLKQRYSEKIDTVASTMDALVAYKINKEIFD